MSEHTDGGTLDAQDKLAVLNEASVEIASILDLDILLENLARILRRFVEHEFLAVLLADQETGRLEWKKSVGFSAETRRKFQRQGVHARLVGRAVRTPTPVIAGDLTREARDKGSRTLSVGEPKSAVVLPLISKERIIGALVLGSRHPDHFRPDHLKILTPLAAHVAVSLENARLYEEVARDAETKQVMNEIGKEMTAILELEELLGRIAALLRRVISYEILGIFLYDPGKQIMELKVAVGYAAETVEKWRYLPLGKGLLGCAAREKRTLLTRNIGKDPRAISAKTADGRWTQSEVAVPLISKDRLLGGLVVESCNPDYFRQGHVQILETLASQIAVSIDNARLFQEVLAKEQKLKADFALARDLQASMLPVSFPELEKYELSSLYRPAESLGGDYYDFIWLDDERLGLAIGDVSGKGVAAAMSMAATRSALRFAARLHSSPSQVLYQVNRRLYRDVKARSYVSLFYGVLYVHTGVFRWSNGGHYPPLVLRAEGGREELFKGGTLIALFDKSRYDRGTTRLFPGDAVCFYTDGVVEARNPTDEEFGAERLEEALRRRLTLSAKEMLRGFVGDMKKFTRGAAQHDDLTMFLLKVLEGSR